MVLQRAIHPADNLNYQPSPVARPRPFTGNWRLTECTGCPGAMLHRALGCPVQVADGDTLNLFHEGYLHEADVKQRLLDAGYVFEELCDQQSPGIKHPELPVYCHPDGFFRPDSEVVEIKSIGDVEDWENVKEDLYVTKIAPTQSWYKQVQGYMPVVQAHVGAPDIRARIIPKDRKSGKVLKSIVVNLDQAVQDNIWGTVRSVVALLKGKQPPFAGVDCNQISQWGIGCSNDYFTRLFCPYNGVHCHKNRQMVDQYLLTLLHEFSVTKVISDRLDKDLNEYRVEIAKVMDELGERSIRAPNGIDVLRYSSKGRLSFKEDDARRLLTPEQFGQIFAMGDEFAVTRITPGDEYRKLSEPIYREFLRTVFGNLNDRTHPAITHPEIVK